MKSFCAFLCSCLFLIAILSFLPSAAFARTVTDMRGKEVSVPDSLSRVATIDDGFVEGVMTSLGVIDAVDMIGSWSMKGDFRYAFKGGRETRGRIRDGIP